MQKEMGGSQRSVEEPSRAAGTPCHAARVPKDCTVRTVRTGPSRSHCSFPLRGRSNVHILRYRRLHACHVLSWPRRLRTKKKGTTGLHGTECCRWIASYKPSRTLPWFASAQGGGGGGCIVAPRHAPCCLYFQFAPADGVDVGRPRAEPVLYQPRDRQVVLAKSQCSPQPPPA